MACQQKPEPDSGFCEAVGLLHPANIFPRPVSTQNLQRSYHALYLLFICIQYHHLRKRII
ncbi:hypothetical protein ECDEC12D_2351 [Escherichia coli DEC12D]|nr:hypothetical protein ECDEC12D_2351 [Escherichia coli DEC12D]